MSAPSDPDLLVLQALRVRSLAATEVIADTVGLSLDEAAAHLEVFQDKEWVRYREGVLTGWMLLPAGRAEGERMLAAELEAIGVRHDVEAVYRSFLALNQRLLRACTDFQLRPSGGSEPVLNDHRDPVYDAGVIDSLATIDREVQPIATSLAAGLARFGRYPARFTRALEKTRAGDADWFAKPTIDSYHTVWFELHENLLSTLGIPRGGEDAS